MKNIPIGEVLKEKGYITQQQLEKALDYHKQHRDIRLGQVLTQLGFVTERQILSAMCDKLNLRMLPLETYPINIEAVKKIPRVLAEKYSAIAVSEADNRLTIVVHDPLNFYGIEDIRQVTGMQLDVTVAEESAIEHAIDVCYSEIEAKQAAATMATEEEQTLSAVSAEAMRELEEGNDTPVIRLLNSLLLHGYNIGASDIHIEPMETQTRVRLRIDGMLLPYMTLNNALHQPLIARTKILSNLDIAEKRSPQDGHFIARVEGVEMNLRVSVVPTIYGEKIVLRYLNSAAVIQNARQFGMNPTNYEKFMRMLQNPNGIIYLTGPTGSGKTTTLYFALEELVKRQVNITTIEDPVERHIRGVNQIQVNPLAGITFESGLRALLRQDPDILMVGETRDNQTAEISVRSAITGHLVLSTLHTNDALSSIIRLQDMGIEPYLLANAVVGLVTQRLVRKICPYCREEYTPTTHIQQLLGGEVSVLSRGKGCPACNHTGYKGRIAVHEIVEIDRTMRQMITTKTPIEQMDTYVREKQAFVSLTQEAKNLVLSGITTAEEMLKLMYSAQ